MFLATGCDHNLVQVSLVIRPRPIPADAVCEMLTKAIAPQPDCFPADNHAPRSQQILNISCAQYEAMVRPDANAIISRG